MPSTVFPCSGLITSTLPLSFGTEVVSVFVFQFLPFGLSTAPWAFTRIIRPIKCHIRIHIGPFHSYLDDFLILAMTALRLSSNVPKIKALIENLGLSFNDAKSDFTPRFLVDYLGIYLNIRDMTLSLPEEKITMSKSACDLFKQSQEVTRRQMECLLGFLSFISRYIQRGRLRLLPLIARMLWLCSKEDRDIPFPQDRKFLRLLAIWEEDSFLRTRVPMHVPSPEVEVMTDASDDGWCGVRLPDTVSGEWEPWQRYMHSN